MKKKKHLDLKATFSECGNYRHDLRGYTKRPFKHIFKPVCFVGANPSQAGKKVHGEIITDNTARRFMSFTERFKATHFIAINIFDYIETHPDALPMYISCSEDNDYYIYKAFKECKKWKGKLIFCWGDCIKELHGRDRWIMSIAEGFGLQPMCFNTTQKGNPGHPLYVKGNTRLKKFRGKKWDE